MEDRSLTRALGLKIGKIVIDAGHGGASDRNDVQWTAEKESGAPRWRSGWDGCWKRGWEQTWFTTRRDDTFIPLETRTAIANRERADLFIHPRQLGATMKTRVAWRPTI